MSPRFDRERGPAPVRERRFAPGGGIICSVLFVLLCVAVGFAGAAICR